MENRPLNSPEKYIDNTLLNPDITETELKAFVSQSLQYDFAGICIPPAYVPFVRELIHEPSDIQLVTVIGFPLGYQRSSVKIREVKQAIEEGADELDMVMNISAFKSGNYQSVEVEIAEIAALCHQQGKILKVIIEVALLEDHEIEKACRVVVAANADFIKTSTGFASKKKALTPEFISTLRAFIPEHIKLKASGGIKDATHAMELIPAGADRIGTSSGLQMVGFGK